jgi:hypothetical protein
MNKNLALKVAGVVFALFAVLHIVRVVTKFDIIINGNMVPMNVSYIGIAVGAILSLWMFKACKS